MGKIPALSCATQHQAAVDRWMCISDIRFDVFCQEGYVLC